jgi:predicted enzyme related to lactoylglutathione lyase
MKVETTYNPVVYFEIPVENVERAMNFYKAVFSFEFQEESIDGNQMALFPFDDKKKGISGALAKGDIYKPSISGVLIYFQTTDIKQILASVVENGGKVLYPKTSNGELGAVAEFQDCEGNRIALYQKK